MIKLKLILSLILLGSEVETKKEMVLAPTLSKGASLPEMIVYFESLKEEKNKTQVEDIEFLGE